MRWCWGSPAPSSKSWRRSSSYRGSFGTRWEPASTKKPPHKPLRMIPGCEERGPRVDRSHDRESSTNRQPSPSPPSEAAMQPRPQLLSGAVSTETLACLERMSEGAREGVIVGLVVGVILNRRRYYVSICGEAHRDPTFARGVL